MLRIFIGRKEDEYYGPSYFKFNYDLEWLEDDLVRKMIKDVDKSEYVGGELVHSDILGPISPRELSGGVQTLICIYKNPDKVFDATSCGPNCAQWLLEIGKRKDVTVALEYFLPFDGYDPIDVYIENTDKKYSNADEYAIAALDLLQEVD
ncbi:MAG: DUF4869 domain-containing protein [Lachnospiraceae bacterium]|nr:DUF4869 domain-containing protein [Lachnospiraceae bacterium]